MENTNQTDQVQSPNMDDRESLQLQLWLLGGLGDAIKSGADARTLAHALATVAAKCLLHFHPSTAAIEIFSRQITLSLAEMDADGETKH